MVPTEALPEGARQSAPRRSSPIRRRFLWLVGLVVFITTLGLGFCSLWVLRPDLLPQRTIYDFVANRHVSERLVDPEFLKVERWQILDEERQVLFVHPAPSGSIALVYPVRVDPGTTFQADLAVAPEAWALDGDGVTFSLFIEDDTGMHLVRSLYVDPKHHYQDRRWVPMRVNLTSFSGTVVRLILVVGSGPAGDGRYDWAGWGEPRLERPVWPFGSTQDLP